MKLSEVISRILIGIGLLLVISVPIAAREMERTNAIEVHAQMAESGGWTPAAIQAQVGVPLHLHLTSDDVVHGFAVGQMDMQAMDVLPGQMAEVSLTFDRPGTYTFYCTRWCGPNHWRMRGTIEVVGGDSASLPSGAPPLYLTLAIDIDAAHPASALPDGIPDAGRGAQFSDLLPAGYLVADYYRSHSPSQAFLDLKAEPALSSLSEHDLWNLVAYLWQSNTTPEGLAEGRRLFARNCAACHGESGGGNGVFSANVLALAGTSPADFSNPASLLGAAPALLQGKILRGGMGTGMPSWGPIFTDQQIWDLVSYLYSFQIKEIPK